MRKSHLIIVKPFWPCSDPDDQVFQEQKEYVAAGSRV